MYVYVFSTLSSNVRNALQINIIGEFRRCILVAIRCRKALLVLRFHRGYTCFLNFNSSVSVSIYIGSG